MKFGYTGSREADVLAYKEHPKMDIQGSSAFSNKIGNVKNTLCLSISVFLTFLKI